MAETSGLRQFLILLYKGMLLRKRHYLVTFFEIVIPIFIASIPCMMKSMNSDYERIYDRYRPSTWQNFSTYSPIDPFDNQRYSRNDIEFLYTPSSELIDQFMNESIQMFNSRVDYKGDITYKNFTTEKELETYCFIKQKDYRGDVIVGTVFNNINKNQKRLPTSLDYKIRYGGYSSFFTNWKYRANGPNYKTDYLYSFFTSWQASVEETFIQKKAVELGKSVPDYKVWLQRFPYPEHIDARMIFSEISIVPWVICYGYLIFIINIVRRAIEEKVNGSKELLKMMGMKDFTYWISTFLNYFIVAFISMIIITILYKAPLKNGAVLLKNTDFMLLLIILTLFISSLILFSMAFSIFFNRPIFGIIAILIVHILASTLLMVFYFVSGNTMKYYTLSVGSKLGICLLPPGALLSAFFLISFYEPIGEGINWSNMTDYTIVPDINLLMILGAMIFSLVLYIFIIWYFDAVWPWQPGVPKPFYFMFMKSYWCRTKPNEMDEINLVKNETSSDYFEEEPTRSLAGVAIKNLSKEFRTGMTSKLAVNDVSLNIYQGQITALLGHNGAGKTTTINILTGLYTPTSGTAMINGYDILTETTKARRGFGVCPQHNVLYDTLTVEEHLKIYAAMKGVPWNQLTSEASKVLDILKLSDKRYELIKSLSGGMKRKLSLGIAVVGDSKVLFLDEPTSGMDVEARRSVWDALLEIRHDRTIILTTHYMEEADILGDRIAIMAEGEVQCCGSPLFLKQKFGTGYHLHVVKDQKFHLDGLTSLLRKHVPEVTLGNELEKEISFNLTSDTNSSFGDMFEELENQKRNLGVTSFGITVTTMEDVFLRVSSISDLKYKIPSDSDNKNGYSIQYEDVYGDSPGMNSYPKLQNQFWALIVKRFHYSKRHWGNLISQFVIPFVLMCLCLFIIKLSGSQLKSLSDPLKLDINSIYGETDGFYYYNKSELSTLTETVSQVFKSNKINSERVQNPSHYVLDYGKKDISKYLKNLIVGGAIDKYPDGTYNLTAWYNGEPYHSTPLSLLLMHTALLQHVTNTGGSISLTNAPIPVMDRYMYDMSSTISKILGPIFVPLALGFLTASFTLLPIHERASKAKLLQLMSGVPPAVYWAAMFLWDYAIYCTVCILLIIPYAMFAHYAFFGAHSEAIGTALLLMFLHGLSAIPFSYLVSFLFKKGNTGYAFTMGFVSVVGVALCSILKAFQVTTVEVTDLISNDRILINARINKALWTFRIFPTFSLASAFSNLYATTFENALCESMPADELQMYCEISTGPSRRGTLDKCCTNICKDDCLKYVYPITWEPNSCGRDVFFLSIDAIIYISLLLMLETNVMSVMWDVTKLQFQKFRKTVIQQIIQENVMVDSDVLEEETRIKNLTEAHPGSAGEALVVSDLTKVYKNFYAVNHLTFGIHEEECFGLLGVNGAGKTTTFRMLTGDCKPDKGNALIHNDSVRTNLRKFQSYLGYCPQFDALIDRLTGREMLELFAQLRGLTGPNLQERVNKMIKMTDLTKYADKQTQFYSGGNKRKLSVAIALIGCPPLILLDEPTAGVDPVSRRKIWNILSQARNNTGAAVLLTTHSMEESEALCNRLAIMVNGRFQCLGSIQQLKSKYGQGYTLIIKMKREDQNEPARMNAIKEHIQSHLIGANLKDDHQGMLQYHIVNPQITLSFLFKFMSSMKVQFELEDYLISDTSLEQIFLAFARAQRATT